MRGEKTAEAHHHHRQRPRAVQLLDVADATERRSLSTSMAVVNKWSRISGRVDKRMGGGIGQPRVFAVRKKKNG